MSELARRIAARLQAAPVGLRWAAAVAWAATLWAISARPGHGGAHGFGFSLFWNSGHIVAYFVLGTLLFAALREAVGSPHKRALAAIALAALYGAVDELHQSTVPGRDSSGWDLLSDTLGATLAVATLLWLDGRARRGWIIAIVPLCMASVTIATCWE